MEKRFVVKEKQNLAGGKVLIIVDQLTGVHYIGSIGGFGNLSLTPLLDETGNVFIEKF